MSMGKPRGSTAATSFGRWIDVRLELEIWSVRDGPPVTGSRVFRYSLVR